MNLQTRAFYLLLKIVNAKKIASREFTKPKRSAKFDYPKSLKKETKTDQFLVNNRNVVTFEPTGYSGNMHIFFLHGGAYAMEAKPELWWMIKRLVKKYALKLSFIDYPLTPEHDYREAHEMVFQSYSKLVDKNPEDNFYFLGDSAGGGFCLSFAQRLRNESFPKMPEKIALLSPWVDISIANPEIKDLEKVDLILDPKEIMICAKNFAGDLDLVNPIVSPLFGDMNGLKSIAVFVGTHEVLLPDCRKLKLKIEASNTSLFYKEYEAMQHDWVIFPVPERKVLLEDLFEYLTN